MSNNYSSSGNLSDGDLRNILYDILKDWWIPVVVALCSCLIAEVIVDFTYKPEYTSSTTVAVSSKDRNETAYTSFSENAATAEILSSLFTSSTMEKLIKEDLGIDKFNARVEVSIIASANLMRVSVIADNPKHSYEVLTSLMENYPHIAEYIIENSVLEVLQEASLPSFPSNYVNTSQVKRIVFWVAFFAMVFVLALISYFKDDIKSEEDVAQKLDVKLFASIPHENKYKTLKDKIIRNKKSVIISNVSASYLFVESFYKLRTKLEYIMNKNNHKVLLITSVLENEGKSSVAANIALALASNGKKVVLVDCDLRNPSQCKLFGISIKNGKEFSNYLKGNCELDEIIQTEERFGLSIILSSKPRNDSVELLSRETMPALIDKLREKADYIILDTSPMLVTADAERLLPFADASLLVIKQNCSRAIHINDMTDIIASSDAELLGCVFNDVRHGIFLKNQKAYYGKGNYIGSYDIQSDITVRSGEYEEQNN